MDDERRAKIAAALRQYGETVTQRSFSLLRTLMEAIEALPPPPNCSEITTQILRLRRLDYYLGPLFPDGSSRREIYPTTMYGMT